MNKYFFFRLVCSFRQRRATEREPKLVRNQHCLIYRSISLERPGLGLILTGCNQRPPAALLGLNFSFLEKSVEATRNESGRRRGEIGESLPTLRSQFRTISRCQPSLAD